MLETTHKKILFFFDYFCGYFESLSTKIKANVIGFHLYVIGDLLYCISAVLVAYIEFHRGLIFSGAFMIIVSITSMLHAAGNVYMQPFLLSNGYKQAARSNYMDTFMKLFMMFLVYITFTFYNLSYANILMNLGIVLNFFGHYMLISNPEQPLKKTKLAYM